MFKMKEFSISFIAIFLVSSATSDECIKCVEREQCEEFGNLNLNEQKAWVLRYPCPIPDGQKYGKIFGFAAGADGDYVCCPTASVTLDSKKYIDSQSPNQQGYNLNNVFGNQNGFGNINPSINPGYNPNVHNTGDKNNWTPVNTINNPNYFDNGINNQNYVRAGNPGFNNNGYPQINPPPKSHFPSNHNPYVTSSPLFPVGNNFDNTSPGSQCAITNFPPKPETGCCGREASDTDRIIVPKAHTTLRPPQATIPNQFGYPRWSSTQHGFPRYGARIGRRVDRSAEKDDVTVTIDDRIAGGKETEFEQFPWTVLLETTFEYGNKTKVTFQCGGSLISSRYVLTAAHCVFDTDGRIFEVKVFLSEYDKRSFPKDCKLVLGQGEKCIENVVMEAEAVVLHPEYDDSYLKNDIALIRLHGNVPYTNYIRPICLPSINVDTSDFLNLRLAVAGWGRNGRNRSDIKQSTIVNLVPQEKCQKFYTDLSRGQVCATGYHGEDTCKGDSGGPLMTLYGGKYEVVGVVSGKRRDSPCGTAVPSLYTNVYHYKNWILNNIKH